MGSSGGGSSGAVSYPAYMQDIHANWLNQSGADLISLSITDVMSSAIGNSPWAVQISYPPDDDIAEYMGTIRAFGAMLAGLDINSIMGTIYSISKGLISDPVELEIGSIVVEDRVVDDRSVEDIAVEDAELADIAVSDASAVGDLVVVDKVIDDIAAIEDVVVDDIELADIADTADVDGITEAVIVDNSLAFANQLDDELLTRVLPRFRRGMQDINSVVSSSYVVGLAVIEAFRDRDLAKFISDLRLTAAMKNADIDLANEGLHLDVRKTNLGKSLAISQTNLSKVIEVVKLNLGKDLDIDKANLLKDVEIEKSNLEKDVQVGSSNISKDLTLSTVNLGKDSDIGRANLGKNLTLAQSNLSKDISIESSNLGKDTELAKINIGKDLGISVGNLSKDVDISKANLSKDVSVGTTNIGSYTNYEKMYLEGTTLMMQAYINKVNWDKDHVHMMVEGNRIKIVAKKEQYDTDALIDESDALWDFGVFQYGANLLASIGGGTSMPVARKPNVAASVLGGAMSGAAAGSMILPGWGTLIGGVLGAAAGFLSTM